MRSRTDESFFSSNGATLQRLDGVTLQEDVEHLIAIAGQLFSAIERQIHSIEESLALVVKDHGEATGQTVLKEHFIRVAANLNASLQEIAIRLEERTERLSLLEHSRINYND
jgi:hypothetical protein